MADKSKIAARTLLVVILLVLAGILGCEIWEQTSENGWNRGTYYFNK
jgi:hypothetical protein